MFNIIEFWNKMGLLIINFLLCNYKKYPSSSNFLNASILAHRSTTPRNTEAFNKPVIILWWQISASLLSIEFMVNNTTVYRISCARSCHNLKSKNWRNFLLVILLFNNMKWLVSLAFWIAEKVHQWKTVKL